MTPCQARNIFQQSIASISLHQHVCFHITNMSVYSKTALETSLNNILLLKGLNTVCLYQNWPEALELKVQQVYTLP